MFWFLATGHVGEGWKFDSIAKTIALVGLLKGRLLPRDARYGIVTMTEEHDRFLV